MKKAEEATTKAQITTLEDIKKQYKISLHRRRQQRM